jgi:hypothetical protein
MKTPAQLKAQKRNMSKWSVAGMLNNAKGVLLKATITEDERTKVGAVIHLLEGVLKNWDSNNKLLGIGGGK